MACFAMIKLSIIVPIYGVEQYLRKCVDSLLNQDIDNYEIILVDDGSPDECPAICDEYAELAKREEVRGKSFSVRVIHRENGGLSAARNSGIEVAQGEYVMFVDSDDYWEENVLGSLMKQVEREQLDVLRFDYQNVNDRYEVYNPNKAQRYIDAHTNIVSGIEYLNTRMGYACYAVMYVMRKSIVPTFTEGIHFEDVDWLPRMMLNAKRVNSTTTTVYNYLVRQGSITKTQGNKKKICKNIEDQMKVMQKYSELIKQYPDCNWLRNMRSSMAAGVLTTVARTFYEEKSAYIERLRNMQVFPLTIANQGKTYARRARIINILGASAYCMMMRLHK